LKIRGVDVAKEDIHAATAELLKFQEIMGRSYNYKLDAVDFTKFNEELKKYPALLTDL
jgi:hypothetical protein